MTARRLAATVVAATWLTAATTTAAVAQTIAAGGTVTLAGTIPGPMDMVRATGNFAYVVDSKVLTIWDISNPATPQRKGSYEFTEKVWGFRMVGPLLYVANGFAGLQILDVSDPAKPILHGAVKNQGQSKNVSVSGNRAVVANHMTGVDLIDTSNPAKPAFIGSGFLDGYARDAAIIGTVAYGVDSPSGLYVFDVAPIASKTFDPTDSFQEGHTPAQIELSDPIAGSRLAVIGGGEPYDPARPRAPGTRPRGTLQLWDLKDPLKPVVAGLYRTPGMPRHFALQGATAYVADSEAGLHLVDLSTPAKPVAGLSFKTPKPARSVAVSGTTILVVVGVTAEQARGGEPTTETLIFTHKP
jgi:hypothetical protein